jgi:hypothetical protein
MCTYVIAGGNEPDEDTDTTDQREDAALAGTPGLRR